MINQPFLLDLGYWAFFGTLYLIILTYQDIRHKRLVNDRYNYLMIGVTISLTSHVSVILWRIFIFIGVILALFIFLNKFKVLGEADIKTISWIFLGYGIINVFYLLWFTAWFIIITLLHYGILKAYRVKGYVPYYPVILASFVVNCIIFHLY